MGSPDWSGRSSIVCVGVRNTMTLSDECASLISTVVFFRSRKIRPRPWCEGSLVYIHPNNHHGYIDNICIEGRGVSLYFSAAQFSPPLGSEHGLSKDE
jgi:hypothetical protein